MVELAPVDLVCERNAETIYLRSRVPLEEPPPTLGALLLRAAEAHPDRTFLIERTRPETPSTAAGSQRDGARHVTYREALDAAQRIAPHLGRGARGDGTVLVLSGNSIDHALVMLAGFLAGVPIAPVSVAYSLMSEDHGKLRHIVRTIRPTVVFVDDDAPYRRAIAAVTGELDTAPTVVTSQTIAAWQSDKFQNPHIEPNAVAKVLFTSGSTGIPKGVPNTHRMLMSNQQMIHQLWPFLAKTPPRLVDWLPWSHTFGGNHNFNMVLWHGGTLFIDDGKPAPALVHRSFENLKRFPPSLYFNVPAGYAALVPELERDASFCQTFFSELQLVFYAGAALPDDLWQRLVRLAEKTTGRAPFMTTAWGSTETSPMSTSAHFHLDRAGNIGVPAPGVSLKLVPNGDKLEVRVSGPHVMTGYINEPALTKAAFDDEGYYRIGDAVRLADPDRPEAGLLFDGRVAEDFKLMSGTWVNVGQLRTELLSACSPVLQDLVVAGQDREGIGILAWPSLPGCQRQFGESQTMAELAASQQLADHLRASVESWNKANPSSSRRILKLALLKTPPSIDAGEITDKGYVNQRTCLERRSADVASLFTDDAGVLSFE